MVSCICVVNRVLIVSSGLFFSLVFPNHSECEDFVRLRWFVYFMDCLFHGLVLLLSGISGKMIIPLDTITTNAMLVIVLLSYVSSPTTCFCQASRHCRVK